MYCWKLIKALSKHIPIQSKLNEIYESDEIIKKLSTVIGAQVYKDWIGRLYVVVNPFIKDGQYTNEAAYDMEGDPSQWIEHHIMERIAVVKQFIYTSDLFDVLTYEIRRIKEDNYLFIIQPISLADLGIWWP